MLHKINRVLLAACGGGSTPDTTAYQLKKYFFSTCRLTLLWLVLGTQSYVYANTDTWVNTGIGYWEQASNWADGTVPTNSENVDAFIDNGGYVLKSSIDGFVSTLSIGDSVAGTSTLHLYNGGTLLSVASYIGNDPLSNGSLIVHGAGTTFGGLNSTIGNSGTGTVVVTSGGKISVGFLRLGKLSGSEGNLTIDGTGSLALASGFGFGGAGEEAILGLSGVGNMTIQNGGEFRTLDIHLGSDVGGEGNVLVDGAGSKLGAWSAFLGRTDGSSGTINIVNGGYMPLSSSFDIGIATGSTGSVSVDGVGSDVLANIRGVDVGIDGQGSLTVTNGGRFYNISALAPFALEVGVKTGQGDVTVDGAGSIILANMMTIGVGGTGTLSLSEGGKVELVSGGVVLGELSASTGTLNIGVGGGAGILDAPTITGGEGTATLNFNHTDSAYYLTNDSTMTGSPVIIAGSTSVNHVGSGTTYLLGANTYTGATTVDAGTLYVNGSNSNSSTTVNTGGTLGGSGSTGSLNVAGGTLAPGNSIGTITVNGDVGFSGGSIYEVEVDDAGNSDLIDATGAATLSGGSVDVQAAAGTYSFVTNYTILSADSGVSGEFDSATSNLSYLNPVLSYDANNVYLSLVRNDVSISTTSVTPNQVAVSNALDTLVTTNPLAVTDLMNNLIGLNDSDVQDALDSLSGVTHSAMPGLSNLLMQRFFQSIHFYRGNQDLSSSFGAFSNEGSSRSLLGLNSGDAFGKDNHWWIQGVSGDGDIDSSADGTIAALNYNHTGFAVGMGMPINNHWALGMAGSLVNSNINGGGSDADSNSYQFAAYANWNRDNWYVDSAIGYGHHDTYSKRTVTVGLTSDIARADYGSDTYAVSVDGSKHFKLNNDMTMIPFAGLEYSKTNRENFTETGSIANLSVDGDEHESIRTKLGLKLSKTFKTGQGAEYIPHASIAYIYEHGDKENLMTASLSGAPNSTFNIEGNDIDRDRLQVNLGVSGKISDNTQFNIAYSGELAESGGYNSLSATLRVHW